MYNEAPNFCTNCGEPIRLPGSFCSRCGTRLPVFEATEDVYPISLSRVILLTVLSFGLYWFYWFYLTWRRYQQHTGNKAYPVWHTLTLFVPIYSLFRTHAHMRVYKELMTDADIPTSISPKWAVVVVLAFWLSVGLDELVSDYSDWAWVFFGFDGFLEAVFLWLMLHVQRDMNRYWNGLDNVRIAPTKTGAGEVFF